MVVLAAVILQDQYNRLVYLRPRFAVHGKLAVYENARDSARLLDTYSGLLIERPGVRRPIHSIADLRGQVEIRSSEAALDYVRLLTAPLTNHFLGSNQYELISERTARSQPLYVLGQSLLGLLIDPGYYGIWDDRDLKKLGLAPASSVWNKAGLEVRRWIATPKDGGRKSRDAVFVLEHVSSDGAYRQEQIKTVSVSDGLLYIPMRY